MFWKTSVGIEVSGEDLRLAVVEQFFKRQRLIKTEVIPGFLRLSDDERLRVFTAIAQKHRLPPSRVFLTLPKDAGIVRQIEFPAQIADKIASAAALQIETISPWPLEELYWACSFESPSKGSKFVRATIVVIPKATLDPWIAFFKSTPLPLSGASVSSPAWAHGATVLWGKHTSMIVLGCEPGSVEGALVNGSQLSALTADGDNVQDQAQSVVERLLALGRVELPESVKLLAHGSAAEGLSSDVQRPPLENAGPASTRHFGAIAAALLGLRHSAFDANLVPTALRHRYNRLLLVPTFVLAFIAVLLSVAWFVRSPYQTLVYGERIDQEIHRLLPQVKDVNLQEAELENMNKRFRTLSMHLRNRDANLEALRELSRILPPDTWINSYTYQDSAVSLSGLSNSAAQVQKVLEDSPLFRDAQLTSTITKDASGKDRFSLRTALEAR